MELDIGSVLARYQRDVLRRQVLVFEQPAVLEIDKTSILAVAAWPKPGVVCVDADWRSGEVALIR